MIGGYYEKDFLVKYHQLSWQCRQLKNEIRKKI
jgi:hypothetical protein